MPREHTIIAAFRSAADARAAQTDLQAAGVAQNDIYLETGGDQSRSKTESNQGGITGWFKSIFGEDDSERTQYESAISKGNCLLRVDVDVDEISTIEDILNRHSPVDIQAGEAAGTSTTASKAKTGGKGSAGVGKTDAIPVVEEELQVGKRQVLRGGVRVYSRVVEEPVEETVQLREERVRVERQPVNRPASEADFSSGREQVVEVQEFAEEPVVAKQARVVEEVRVGKDVSQRKETVRDTVRRTEVDVEQTPQGTGATASSYDDSDFRTDYQSRYGATGSSYDTYLPAYRYGYDMASDPRYQGRSFDEVESDLQSDYSRRYPQSTWEKMKDAIRYGWDKVTGKARATAS